MFRKLTLALVAAASLSAVALAPTAASAWHKHHHHHHPMGMHFGVGFVDPGFGGCYQTRRVLTPFGYRFRVVNVCALLIGSRFVRFKKPRSPPAAGVFVSRTDYRDSDAIIPAGQFGSPVTVGRIKSNCANRAKSPNCATICDRFPPKSRARLSYQACLYPAYPVPARACRCAGTGGSLIVLIPRRRRDG